MMLKPRRANCKGKKALAILDPDNMDLEGGQLQAHEMLFSDMSQTCMHPVSLIN